MPLKQETDINMKQKTNITVALVVKI